MIEPGTWGAFGDEPPCSHLLALREHLVANGLTVWSEHGEQPHGWVNVHCEACKRTYETTLRARSNGEWADEDPREDGDA